MASYLIWAALWRGEIPDTGGTQAQVRGIPLGDAIKGLLARGRVGELNLVTFSGSPLTKILGC